MAETLHLRPELLSWWRLLETAAKRSGPVHRWRVADQPQVPDLDGVEQHPTATLVLCLAGNLRIEGRGPRLDLAPGEALILQAGVWHRHAPLRTGTVAFSQGLIAGRSDFFLETRDLHVVATWPDQPARALLEHLAATPQEAERRPMLARLLLRMLDEPVTPLPTLHPADLPMTFALWQNLHRPDAVARIVAASGLSRVQAERVFRLRWHRGIAGALRDERLTLANILLGGGLPVSEVAGRCGFRDRSVFSRAFHRRWGRSPASVRRP